MTAVKRTRKPLHRTWKARKKFLSLPLFSPPPPIPTHIHKDKNNAWGGGRGGGVTHECITYNLFLQVKEVECQKSCFCCHHGHFVIGLSLQVMAHQGQVIPNMLPHTIHKGNVDRISYGQVLQEARKASYLDFCWLKIYNTKKMKKQQQQNSQATQKLS